MINIFADVIQVIMLAPCTDTLLSVGSSYQTTHVTLRVNSTLEDWLKLYSKNNKHTIMSNYDTHTHSYQQKQNQCQKYDSTKIFST